MGPNAKIWGTDDWMLITFVVGFFAGALALHVAFLFTVYRCLLRVDPDNRELAPGFVWLAIIPLFNHIFYLIMVPRVTASLRNEWRARDWYVQTEDFGHRLGMTYSIGTLIIACCMCAPATSGWNCVVSGAWLVLLMFWIGYWVRIAGLARRLGSARPPGDEFADYDDEFRPTDPEAAHREEPDGNGMRPWPREGDGPPLAEPVDE
ncbi:MAG TPA: hypothetical protein VHR66_14885 [Gemmataceae bacterium]|jgi:hypothetical protein|nr:hypothetical protein [Gemmataceae bacterium]